MKWTRFDRLRRCAHCGGRPIVLLEGLTSGEVGCTIECTNCGIRTPTQVFGREVDSSLGGEAGITRARTACAALWNQRISDEIEADESDKLAGD